MTGGTYRELDLDAERLADLFGDIDTTHFLPHPMTVDEARRIAAHSGRDVYVAREEGGRYVAYGMLRGLDAGYVVPSLGVAVRRGHEGRGHGTAIMEQLHDWARGEGLGLVRLRVHPENHRARRLYDRMGYVLVAYERDEHVMVKVLR